MNMIEAINIVHADLNNGFLYPYYFRHDQPPVVSLKYCHPKELDIYFYVVPPLCTSRIFWTSFSKENGVIIERKNNRHVWYNNGDTFTIPKIDASNDRWFNFSVLHGLTKEIYQKYLEILKYAELLQDEKSNVW